MLYYRVKPEFDNHVYNNNFDFLVGNELYTEKELTRKKILFGRGVTFNMFEQVTIPKNKTFFFFGARFADNTGVALPF